MQEKKAGATHGTIQNCVKELDVIAVMYAYYTMAYNQSHCMIIAMCFVKLLINLITTYQNLI